MAKSHSGRLSTIPACAFDDRLMTPTLIRVLGALASYGNQRGYCWPSQQSIGERIGVTRNSVNMSLRTLEKLGYVTSVRRKRENGAESSKAYRLNLDILLPRERYRVSPDDDTPVSPEFTGGVSPEFTQNVPDSERDDSERTYAPQASRESAVQKSDQDVSPDPMWIAFADEVPVPITRSGRGAWIRALRELRDAGASPESIHLACHTYRERWPAMALTPTAIAKHWHVLNGAQNGTTPGSSQHQQYGDSTSTDRARSQEREFAFQIAFKAWLWELGPADLETDEHTLRERFACIHPELAPERDGALASA